MGGRILKFMDASLVIIYVSPTSKPILGIEAGFFIGKNAFDFIHEDDKALGFSHFATLPLHKSVALAPFRFINATNQLRWIESILTNMKDDPDVGGVIVNSRDVTERIENEIKMMESIDRYNIVSKATSEAIWDWDVIRGDVYWNKGIKGIFGYDGNSFSKEWWYQKIHPDYTNRVVRKVESVISKKKSRFESEFRFLCANGVYKHVLNRGFIIFNKAKEPLRVIGAMQDITDRVNYTQAIEEKNRMLKDIAWTQSHIVRTPVARILGLLDLLDGSENAQVRKDVTNYLKISAQELDSIVRGIAKKTEICKTTFTLRRLPKESY